MKPFAILLVFALLVTLLFLKKDNPVVIAPHSTHFPVVINKYLRNPDTIHYFESNELTNALPIFMGKHRLSDTILLKKPQTYLDESIPGYDLIKSETTYDSLDFSGLEIVADYGTTFPMLYRETIEHERSEIYAYFPVYIINNNNTERYFNFESHFARGIQIKDTPFFEPIEFLEMPWLCFDMNYFVKLLPGEFVILLFKKYEGDIEGHLRILVQNGGIPIYSAPYKANYNKSQTNFGVQYDNVIKPNPDTLSHIYYYFLGRLPQQFLIPNSKYPIYKDQ